MIAEVVNGTIAVVFALCIERLALSCVAVIVRADNWIGAVGCESLCGSLRVNSTLTTLAVSGECDCVAVVAEAANCSMAAALCIEWLAW